MIHLSEEVQASGITAPRFELFQKVRIYVECEDGYVFEGEGVICGLLLEHSVAYPTSQFFLDGWWYDIAFYKLPAYENLPPMYREWVIETELLPLV